MPKFVNYILMFSALVVGQAVIFDNLILFNSAVALVFLYLIISLPAAMSVNTVLSISFALGLSIDIFRDTPGMNAFACTVIGFIRRPILHLYVPRDEDFGDRKLCIRTLGASAYLKYMFTLVLLYCIIYFSIETGFHFNLERLLLRVAGSCAYTFIVLYAIDSLTLTRREKRL